MAMLSYELLLLEYPKSSFAYAASKNLVGLYREDGNYPKALEICKKMLDSALNEEQKSHARKEMESLKVLAESGNDPKKIILSKKYESLGKHKTREGRIAGTELAEFIWNAEKYSDAALSISERIYAEQTKSGNIDAECLYAAKNAVILAEGKRHDNDCLSSAGYFLAAAKYSRMGGSNELASRALYGAAESFDAAGKKGDAKNVAENLIELYPDTVHAKSVREFLKR